MDKPVFNFHAARAFTNLLNKFKVAALDGPPQRGFRSGGYTSPADFYNHKSGSFAGNRRRELKRRRQ